MEPASPTSGLFARVVIDLPTRALSEPFDYAVPPSLSEAAVLGAPVAVPLGSTVAAGYVVGRCDSASVPRTRDILAVLGEPLFGEEAFELARWISHEYVAPLSESLRLFLPPGGAPRLVRDGDDPRSWTVERPRAAAVTERIATLVPGAAEFKPRANARLQISILAALAEGPVTVGELRAEFGGVDGALSRLEEAGAIELVERRRYRAPGGSQGRATSAVTLSPDQSSALGTIRERMDSGGGVVVLDGVTGSGKTEVYMCAVEHALQSGGGAVVLVPEISLTPQTVGRFRQRLGDNVAVMHSRLSVGERFDEWQRAYTGQARVVVGARSALFAPVRNVRVIVIDEEHDSSYKQGSAPRYHARAVAERLAASAGAVLVLGSATPDIETRHRCESGAWTRSVLSKRVSGGKLPEVRIVDMAAEFNAGHRSMFSRPLLEELTRLDADAGKGVLLLNRRGYAPFLLCRECGFVPSCDSCSVSLTYHEAGRRLTCHHCGANHPVPATCPSCQSPYLRVFGAGTQRVEAELAQAFPDLPVVRMDADTTKGKGGHERRLMEFESLKSGILVGTQMVAKGLDYPDVRLVGVLNADTALHLPDFRSGERTFQLVAQVAGRAGRGSEPGIVIVQTYWPTHTAITCAAAHDADAFYRSEIIERRELSYPPYSRLVDIEISSESDARAKEVASEVAKAARGGAPDGWTILGPGRSCVSRVKRRWRWHVLVKTPPDCAVAEVLVSSVPMHTTDSDVTVTVDIDPVDLL